eukprot:COSAG06_NODE_1471_length_9351_cov_18.052637_11_plen_124_part_00
MVAATVPMPKPELELEPELEPEPELLELDQELVLALALEQVLVAVVVEPPPTASASHGPQSPCIQRRLSSRMPQHRRHLHPKRGLNSSHHHKVNRRSTCYWSSIKKTYTTAVCRGSSLASLWA